nr:RidA family protein [Rubrobacter calidifluminis]
MMERKNISSGTRWEEQVGYSRAVRVGPFVYVSGTTATDEEGEVVGPEDAYTQTVRALKNVEAALEGAGARLADVVRTRMFVTDMGLWEEVGRAHREVFGEVRPAATMVEVGRLISSEMLVEVEAEAIVVEGQPTSEARPAASSSARSASSWFIPVLRSRSTAEERICPTSTLMARL